jgi:hypothetical protein
VFPSGEQRKFISIDPENERRKFISIDPENVCFLTLRPSRLTLRWDSMMLPQGPLGDFHVIKFDLHSAMSQSLSLFVAVNFIS